MAENPQSTPDFEIFNSNFPEATVQREIPFSSLDVRTQSYFSHQNREQEKVFNGPFDEFLSISYPDGTQSYIAYQLIVEPLTNQPIRGSVSVVDSYKNLLATSFIHFADNQATLKSVFITFSQGQEDIEYFAQMFTRLKVINKNITGF